MVRPRPRRVAADAPLTTAGIISAMVTESGQIERQRLERVLAWLADRATAHERKAQQAWRAYIALAADDPRDGEPRSAARPGVMFRRGAPP